MKSKRFKKVREWSYDDKEDMVILAAMGFIGAFIGLIFIITILLMNLELQPYDSIEWGFTYFGLTGVIIGVFMTMLPIRLKKYYEEIK